MDDKSHPAKRTNSKEDSRLFDLELIDKLNSIDLEVFTSEFLTIFEEIFYLYYVHNDIYLTISKLYSHYIGLKRNTEWS